MAVNDVRNIQRPTDALKEVSKKRCLEKRCSERNVPVK